MHVVCSKDKQVVSYRAPLTPLKRAAQVPVYILHMLLQGATGALEGGGTSLFLFFLLNHHSGINLIFQTKYICDEKVENSDSKLVKCIHNMCTYYKRIVTISSRECRDEPYHRS